MTCNECKRMTECSEDAFINGAKFDPDASAQYCTGFEPYTNADRIRAMSDEELAEIIICPKQIHITAQMLVCQIDCDLCVLEWLQQPAEEG